MHSVHGVRKELSEEGIEICIEGYFDAFDNEEIEAEAAGNFLSIWMLMFMMMKTVPEVMNDRPAALMQVASRDPKAKKIIDNVDPNFEKDAKDIIQELRDPEIDSALEKMIVTLKHSHRWSDLADYYIALKYMWNLVDNDLGADFNRRVGAEMLGAFVQLDNVYAARFLMHNMESLGQSSQSVDDK